jgi:NAD(P)-dependent dehydrogenase (short-subunit alcohol dehydrogenase family)
MVQYWVITGANRGIGLALVQLLAAKKDIVVFAGVRDHTKIGALAQVKAKHNNVHVVEIPSGNVKANERAAAEIAKVTDHVDVLVANAGIANNWQKLELVDADVVREHLEVNTVGTFVLFKAFLPLLRKAGESKFVPITTEVASATRPVPYPVTAVSISKAATNFLTRRIVVEHADDGIIAFPINPGGVKTDIGAQAAKEAFGMEEFSLTAEESASGIISVIEKADKSANEKFFSYDGSVLPW